MCYSEGLKISLPTSGEDFFSKAVSFPFLSVVLTNSSSACSNSTRLESAASRSSSICVIFICMANFSSLSRNRCSSTLKTQQCECCD